MARQHHVRHRQHHRRASPHLLDWSELNTSQQQLRLRALQVLSDVRKGGGSLTARARVHGISRGAARRATGSFYKRSGRWFPRRRDSIQRWVKSYEVGRRVEVLIDDSRTATLLSKYAHAVNAYLYTHDPGVLRHFRGATYRDAFGKAHTIEIDPASLRAAIERSESDFGAFADLYAEPEEADSTS